MVLCVRIGGGTTQSKIIVELTLLFLNNQEEVLGDTASSQTRLLATLEAQRVALNSQLNTSQAEQAKVATRVEAARARLKEVQEERLKLDHEINNLGVVDSPENKK